MPASAIRITLVRHGESVANRAQRWQGQGDSPLSELGEAQARALARRLRERVSRGEFDLVVASDLERASATARALEVSFERDAAFREFNIGAWEGLTREDVVARYAKELARLEAGEDVAIGGGESYASFCRRVDDAFERLVARLDAGQHALVVCHGGVIGAIVCGALGLRGMRDLPLSRVFNTSLSELSFDGEGQVTLRAYNDSLHLGELSLFPHPVETLHSLALVCAEAPHASFGEFEAVYDLATHAETLSLSASCAFSVLHERVRAVHPERRVALSAAPERILGWAREILHEGRSDSGLEAPRAGALCHVTVGPKRPLLIDYGVAR